MSALLLEAVERLARAEAAARRALHAYPNDGEDQSAEACERRNAYTAASAGRDASLAEVIALGAGRRAECPTCSGAGFVEVSR